MTTKVTTDQALELVNRLLRGGLIAPCLTRPIFVMVMFWLESLGLTADNNWKMAKMWPPEEQG